jgi:hypothetical protein
MDPYVKDLIDSLAKVAGLLTVAAGLATLWLQLHRWREDRLKSIGDQERTLELRREELRWRKASLARDVLDQLFRDTRAFNAMRMLDWSGRTYEVDGNRVVIGTQTMLHSLRIEELRFAPEEAFVRDSFESLFDHMQLIEHFLTMQLLEFDDVRYPFSYYADLMAKRKSVFAAFLSKYGYTLAMEFLNRFSSWRAAGDVSPMSPATA